MWQSAASVPQQYHIQKIMKQTFRRSANIVPSEPAIPTPISSFVKRSEIHLMERWAERIYRQLEFGKSLKAAALELANRLDSVREQPQARPDETIDRFADALTQWLQHTEQQLEGWRPDLASTEGRDSLLHQAREQPEQLQQMLKQTIQQVDEVLESDRLYEQIQVDEKLLRRYAVYESDTSPRYLFEWAGLLMDRIY